MRSNPSLARLALGLLALLHAWSGALLLLASDTLPGGAHLVAGGALLLAAAAAGAGTHEGLALGLGMAAAASLVGAASDPGALALAGGLAAAALGAAWREARPAPAGWLLRGGAALAALGYGGSLGLHVATGGAPLAAVDLALRAAAALLLAATLDAPPLRVPRRNGFAESGPMGGA